MTDNKETPGWSKIDSYKEMKVIEDGRILVIKPIDSNSITVPLFCSYCSYPMKTAEDSIAFRKAQMCGKCSLYSHGNKENIQKTSESWTLYMENRKLTSKPLFKFK